MDLQGRRHYNAVASRALRRDRCFFSFQPMLFSNLGGSRRGIVVVIKQIESLPWIGGTSSLTRSRMISEIIKSNS